MTDKKWEDANAISKDDVVLYLLRIREHSNGLIADARAASAAALQESLERNYSAIFTAVDVLRSSSFTRDSWKMHIDDFDRQCVYAMLRDRRSLYESKLAGFSDLPLVVAMYKDHIDAYKAAETFLRDAAAYNESEEASETDSALNSTMPRIGN